MSGGLYIGGDTSGSVLLVPTAIAGSTTVTIAAQSGTLNVGGPCFSAVTSAATTAFSSSTWTKMTLDTELFDTNNCFASSRFTPTVAGYYQINGNVYNDYSSGASGGCRSAIYKNGVLNVMSFASNSSTTYNYGCYPVSAILYLNGTTDYVELYAYNTNNSPYYQGSNDTYRTWMMGALIRTA